jgi:hypothetical protein
VNTPRRYVGVESSWALLLIGPAVAMLHFLVVYSIIEAACEGGPSGREILGLAAESTVLIGLTIVAVGVLVPVIFATVRTAKGTDPDRRFMGEVAALLTAVSMLTIAAVGLPAVAIQPCQLMVHPMTAIR